MEPLTLPFSGFSVFAFATPPSLWQVLGLILAIVVAVALTIVIVLGAVSLLTGVSFLLIDRLRRWLFPIYAAQEDARAARKSDAPVALQQEHLPFFRNKQIAHGETVVELAISADSNLVVSAGRDRTLRFWERTQNRIQTVSLSFFPGPLVIGNSANGPRVALGIFNKDEAENTDAILVWEPVTSGTEPVFHLQIPGIRNVLTLAWDMAAERLRALALVYDNTRPLAPNGSSESPNRILLVEFDLSNADSGTPIVLPLPPELDAVSFWSLTDASRIALSRNGRWLACRTVTNTPDSAGKHHGIGVWDVQQGIWQHRFGGCEAQPHQIHYVTEDGDTVFSTREDDPRRDHHSGGPEWYDGVYVWDASSPPEGTEEARPHPTMHGGRGMVLNLSETLSTASSSTGSVAICDVPSRTLRQTVTRPSTDDPAHPYGSNVWATAFSDATGEFMTGHADGQLWIWRLTMQPGTPALPSPP